MCFIVCWRRINREGAKDAKILGEIEKTLRWIMSLELPGGGIAAYAGSGAYPEVSGYLIPTFYDYGEREIAGRLANWLLTIQNLDGSFDDMKGKARTFDTGACMEGLQRAYEETGEEDYDLAWRRARDWLKEMELPSGALRVSPGSERTHAYTMRVSGLFGNKVAARYWKEQGWGVIRTHYAAYALEGMWLAGRSPNGGDSQGFVMAQLLLARKAIGRNNLMPFEAGSSWRDCRGTDTCATAQMAILYHKAGMQEDARRLAEGVGRMVDEDGGVRMGVEHAERNSWTAKWVLDMNYELGPR